MIYLNVQEHGRFFFDSANSVHLTDEQVPHTYCLIEHCSKCEAAVGMFTELVFSESNVLSMEMNVTYLYGMMGHERYDKRKRREKRDKKIQELAKNVSALRNTNGGCVLIHLVGLASEDVFTGAFDEFVDVKLNNLIQDGSLFSDVYRKERLSCHPHLKHLYDFLCLYVSASSTVTTSNFNTKIALDDCIIEPTAETLRNFLRKRRQFTETFHRLPGIKCSADLEHLHESRSVEIKGHFISKESDEEIARSLLKNYKLAEYITAFSKLEGGGSYFYGVNEVPCTKYGYASRTLRPDPVVVSNLDYLRKTLEEKIRDAVLVCDYDGNILTEASVAKVHFIPCTSDHETKDRSSGQPVIIHVSVRSVNGIVFYDKLGPLAYIYDYAHRLITKIGIQEWMRMFLQTKV
ncbi:uncharacterized protein LOC124288809 isoform X2 [Haliotis rubra]|uniref:uncharacterized protein LOC124288809 isoform X2 n=1 Tax=Haliotis rubra TaxID=36100 RepID=UPI001EE5DDA2|nr:uncharacterized protein LOC124288809 isoform X2 [Haliotis rubra]